MIASAEALTPTELNAIERAVTCAERELCDVKLDRHQARSLVALAHKVRELEADNKRLRDKMDSAASLIERASYELEHAGD